jgi:hypothetical protein
MLKHLEPGDTELFPVENGQTRWWNLRFLATLTAGTGGVVSVKINGQDIPTEVGGVFLHLNDPSFVKRTASVDVRLDDGDVVSVNLDAATGTTVDLSAQATVLPDDLESDEPEEEEETEEEPSPE